MCVIIVSIKSKCGRQKFYDNRFWKARFRNYRMLVAEDRGEIIGFAEFERPGHIDCFYVHHLWQGRGIGTALLRRIVQQAADSNIKRLFADISITAWPFFLRHGFHLVKEQSRAYRGLLFKQFFIEKGLE